MSLQHPSEVPEGVQRLTLAIYGLGGGGGGTLSAERALAQLAGVRRVYVNPATEMAYVEYIPGLVTPQQMIAAVAGTGLQAGEPHLR